MLKRMMFVLVFMVSAFTAFSVEISDVKGKSKDQLVSFMAELDENGWIDLLNMVDEGKDWMLQMNVVIAADNAINLLEKQTAARLAFRIEEEVPSIGVSKSLDGRWRLYMYLIQDFSDFLGKSRMFIVPELKTLSSPAVQGMD